MEQQAVFHIVRIKNHVFWKSELSQQRRGIHCHVRVQIAKWPQQAKNQGWVPDFTRICPVYGRRALQISLIRWKDNKGLAFGDFEQVSRGIINSVHNRLIKDKTLSMQ